MELDAPQQLDEATKTVAVLKVTEQEGGVSPFVNWWNTVRPRLVKVAPLEWGEQQTQKQPIELTGTHQNALKRYLHGKPGRCRAQFLENDKMVFGSGDILELDNDGNAWRWTPIEFPVRPEILAEPGVLRELFRKLGVTIKLYWKPKGKRFFELDRGRLEAELKWHFVDRRSSRSSHVRSPGMR